MSIWETKKLGEVIKLEYGKPLPKESREEGGKYPAYGANGVKCWSNQYYLDRPSIIVGRKGSAGEVNLTQEKFWPLDVTYFVTYDHTQYDLTFLYHCLKYLQLTRLAKGVKPGINRNDVYQIEFAFPPLSEQKRIVAILDEAFEGIDRAIANTEKNLTNASELFETYLNAIFTKKGKGWTEKKLGDIATFRNGLNFTKSSKGESIKIVGVKDFQNYFWIQEDQLDSVTIDAELKEIDILRKGDILTVRSNGNKELIGRCVLAGDLSQKTSHSGFTIRIRIESEDIYPQFIVYSLKSRYIRKQLIESGGGISISSLNQQGLSLIILSFPNFLEQKTIVANIDELAAETQRLETIYQKKIAALNELKQSILRKAFTGELTADTANQITKAAQEVNAA
ncbi:MAG TPA: restriction endonuclease subunit S [Leptolyngbyaceae cyanobacterium]